MKFDIAIPDLNRALQEAKKRSMLFSIARIAVFIGLVSIGIVGITDNLLLLLLLIPITALFIYFIIRFNYFKDLEAFLLELQKMDVEKQKRFLRDLNTFDSGGEYADKHHPFANDLDLFGSHSLFQLLNHTVTKSGRTLLAHWLKMPMDPLAAKARHTAILELSQKKNFIANFEAIGRAFIKKEKSKEGFYKWLDEETFWNKSFYFPLFIGPIGGLLLLGLVLAGVISTSWISLWILIGIGFLFRIFNGLQHAAHVMPDQGDIKTYALWAEMLEEEKFEDQYLLRQQAWFKHDDYSTTKALNSLEQKSFLIQNRFNLMYVIFNLLFWMDFFILWRTNRWKDKYSKNLVQLEVALDHWQVLISMAAFTAAHPSDCHITWEESETVKTLGISHPLLKPAQAIANDFEIGEDKKIVLLTGSNMSGKTTFMRTLGINMVLGNLGLHPFAKDFHIGPFQLFTSMRNTDNLGESVSSFYAELARIKQLLQTAEKGEKVFFLMDEILKGTNTTDRIMGSEALIHQLAGAGGKGIISTHDIELAQLEHSLAYLINKSFHSEILDQEIIFDYKIKNGPCPSFNAHKLMELMGIRFN